MIPIPANIPVDSTAPIRSNEVIPLYTGIKPNHVAVISTGTPVLVFMKQLIKLQKENNNLLKEIANKNNDTKDENAPMPHTELEK